MAYQLGVDFGTTYTAAAIRRAGKPEAEVVPLGTRATSVASVVFVAADGSLVIGEAAERRALTDPDRVVREFKRRIGDGTPMVVGGDVTSAQDLAARVVRRVVDRIAEREGAPPSAICVTHPAGWGPHKREMFATALRAAGLGRAVLLAEPQAAATGYASEQRVEPGSTVAVYDLGGGTFDAAVVRKTPDGGFELLGRPEGIEHLGGADFDEAVFEHVRAAVGDAWAGIDMSDPGTLAALGRLRRDCGEAKEALSADTEVTVPVVLPGVSTQVRLVRAEFEDMIRPAVEETVEALRRAIASAELTSADVSAVLLVGGSSRIPLVTELVSGRLGRPVAVDTDPGAIVALGAALAVGEGAAAGPVAGAVPDGAADHAADDPAHAASYGVDGDAASTMPIAALPQLSDQPGDRPERPAREPAPLRDDEDDAPDRPRQRTAVLAATLVSVAAAVLIAVAVFWPGGIFDGAVDEAGATPAPGAPATTSPGDDASTEPGNGDSGDGGTEPRTRQQGGDQDSTGDGSSGPDGGTGDPDPVPSTGGGSDPAPTSTGGASWEPDPTPGGGGGTPTPEPTDEPDPAPSGGGGGGGGSVEPSAG